MLTEQRKEEIVHLCQELVRIPSYSGQEGDVAQAIRSIMGKLGFDDIRVDAYGNVTGGIKGIRPGKRLILDGHIDTVPVEDANVWSKDPFGGELENGRIYGRGTSDMKGAVAAMLAAVGFFGADKKRDFAGSVYVSCVVHEECFEGVAARSVSQQLKPDCVIIGECSELNLKKGQRGRAEIVLETFGRPAHSANPEAGRNAVYAMAQLIERIRELPMTAHPVLGKGILELTDIKSAPYPGASVVPEYCRATYDRRLLVGETPETVLQPLQELVAAWNAQQDGLSAKVSYAKGKEDCYTGGSIEGERFFPGWLLEESHPWVQTALQGLKQAGLNPTLTQYSFCTNGSHYAGEAGIPTIGFGPSRENLAHTIDEHIEVEQLQQAVCGYYGILQAALEKEGW